MKTIFAAIKNVVFLIFILCVLFVVFFNTILKYGITKFVNTTTKYELTIDKVQSDFKVGNLTLSNVKVTKDNQITTIKKIICDFDNRKLLEKQLDIKLLAFEGLHKEVVNNLKNPTTENVSDVKLQLPKLDSLVDIKKIDLNKNINDISTKKIENYANSFRENINKLKPYLTTSTDKSTKTSIVIEKIKVDGMINQDVVVINKNLILNNNTINLKADINSKDIDKIDAVINTNFIKTSINYKNKDNNDKVIADVLSSVEHFDLRTQLNFSLKDENKYDVGIKSDLGKILEEKFNDKLKTIIVNKVQKNLDKFKTQLKQFFK